MAKKGKFKCSACGRSFGMAAHLGRHRSTVHAPKGKRVAPAAKAKRVKRPFKTLGLGGAAGLAAVVGDIQRYRDEVAAQRAALDSQMAGLDQALTVLGAAAPARKAPPGKGRRGAGYRPGSLKAHIQQVLQTHGGVMAAKAVTAAACKAGYKSKNKALVKSVGVALREMRDVAKVGRGVFRAK
jgi:ElaB/YqjD/DUF883 family membrane-anchored ribosome-binding protein